MSNAKQVHHPAGTRFPDMKLQAYPVKLHPFNFTQKLIVKSCKGSGWAGCRGWLVTWLDDSRKFQDGYNNNYQADDIDHVVHGILRYEFKLTRIIKMYTYANFTSARG